MGWNNVFIPKFNDAALKFENGEVISPHILLGV